MTLAESAANKMLPNGPAPESAADGLQKSGKCSAMKSRCLNRRWRARPRKFVGAVGESSGKHRTTLYLKAAASFRSRPSPSLHRKCRKKPRSHVYPKTASLLCAKNIRRLENKKARSPVEEILIERNRPGDKSQSETQAVSAVVSTAPANILAKLVKGTDSLENFKNFRYRPMIFVNMRFNGRGLLADTVLWLPEKEFPFFRLTEATLSMPWLAPEGKTIITVDIGCQKDDEFWTMDKKNQRTL